MSEKAQNVINVITEHIYHPIELYLHEMISSNIYLGVDSHKKEYFMLLTSPQNITESLKQQINELNCKPYTDYLLPFVAIYNKNENESYLIYEYCHGLYIEKYILLSEPTFQARLSLLKQFLEILILLHNNIHIQLYNFNSNFCFVENSEQPILKMLYNINGLIKNKVPIENEDGIKVQQNEIVEEKIDDFYWLSRTITIICRYPNLSHMESFTRFFNEFEESVSMELRTLFTKAIHKCQGKVEMKEYSLKMFTKEFNDILNKLAIGTIRKDLYETIIERNENDCGCNNGYSIGMNEYLMHQKEIILKSKEMNEKCEESKNGNKNNNENKIIANNKNKQIKKQTILKATTHSRPRKLKTLKKELRHKEIASKNNHKQIHPDKTVNDNNHIDYSINNNVYKNHTQEQNQNQKEFIPYTNYMLNTDLSSIYKSNYLSQNIPINYSSLLIQPTIPLLTPNNINETIQKYRRSYAYVLLSALNEIKNSIEQNTFKIHQNNIKSNTFITYDDYVKCVKNPSSTHFK